jgi:hypothetical protein
LIRRVIVALVLAAIPAAASAKTLTLHISCRPPRGEGETGNVTHGRFQGREAIRFRL